MSMYVCCSVCLNLYKIFFVDFRAVVLRAQNFSIINSAGNPLKKGKEEAEF